MGPFVESLQEIKTVTAKLVETGTTDRAQVQLRAAFKDTSPRGQSLREKIYALRRDRVRLATLGERK
jgi:hypothetical protein